MVAEKAAQRVVAWADMRVCWVAKWFQLWAARKALKGQTYMERADWLAVNWWEMMMVDCSVGL